MIIFIYHLSWCKINSVLEERYKLKSILQLTLGSHRLLPCCTFCVCYPSEANSSPLSKSLPPYIYLCFYKFYQSFIYCRTLFGIADSEFMPSKPKNFILFHLPKSFSYILCDFYMYCSKKSKN
jgi:hypothetical protein